MCLLLLSYEGGSGGIPPGNSVDRDELESCFGRFVESTEGVIGWRGGIEIGSGLNEEGLIGVIGWIGGILNDAVDL